MKKIVFASFVAAASLGLAACAEPADDTATVEDDGAAAVEEDEVEVNLPDTDLTDLPVAEETAEGMEPEAEVNPDGDANGPRPNEE